MNIDKLNPDKTDREKIINRWIGPVSLILLSTVMLFTGLSIRSLWGSEGRWAEIAREMIMSGNYFLPTINGNVYFDKPLLSYWLILPFSLQGVVTEFSSRLPSAISGIGVILITFMMGSRLFNKMTGILSAMILSTTVMFILWSRTASAEMLNVFMIWLALLIFFTDNRRGNPIHIFLLYIIGAVAAFCKGPVAPAVIFISIGFYSTAELFINLKNKGFTCASFKERFYSEFYWIYSWKGLAGLLTGLTFFTGFLLAPVVLTGSWQSVELMWRENILRFLKPFDHIEPFYIYLKYIPLFSAPWTLFLIASIMELKKWEYSRLTRCIVIIAISIFIFFTSSGSRRSYYILPIMPSLAIITGKVLSDWLDSENPVRKKLIDMAAILTAILVALAGTGLLLAYFHTGIPRHISQLALGTTTIAAAAISFRLLLKQKQFRGFLTLFSMIFIIELWAFTIGMAVAENNRTLLPFAKKTALQLQHVDDSKIAIYQLGDSALIFYLKRKPLKYYDNLAALKDFIHKNPDGFIIAELNTISSFQSENSLGTLIPIIIEKPVLKKKDDPIALFAVSSKK